MTVLLCFSGAIGSGKSSVSASIGEVLGWPRTSFGDYVRAEVARIGGDSTSRQILQDFGQARVEADAVAFCHDVLEYGGFKPGMNFIIDGVRHLNIYSILTRLAEPTKARLIFLAVDDVSRARRVEKRGDRADLVNAERHRVEAGLRESLPQAANAIVDASKSFATVVDECLKYAKSFSDYPNARSSNLLAPERTGTPKSVD